MLTYEKNHSQHKELLFIMPQPVFRYGMHLHTGMEFFLCMRGAAEATVGGRRHPLKSGDAIVIFPSQIHGYATQEPSELLAVLFPPDMADDVALAIRGKTPLSPVFSPSPALIALATDCLACADVRRAEPSGSKSATFSGHDLSSRFRHKALAYSICGEFFQSCSLEPAAKREPDMLAWVFSHIQDNYASDITLRDVAAASGYEYCYLSKLLKGCTGMTFADFLNGHRVNRARYLLENTALGIAEIAMQAGFGTLRSFNRAFLKQAGQPPREYRRQACAPGGGAPCPGG